MLSDIKCKEGKELLSQEKRKIKIVVSSHAYTPKAEDVLIFEPTPSHTLGVGLMNLIEIKFLIKRCFAKQMVRSADCCNGES